MVDYNPKKSAYLDIINSLVYQLETNVCENVSFYTDKYFSGNYEEDIFKEIVDDGHITKRNDFPQIAFSEPKISEYTPKRTFYHIEKFNSTTQKFDDYGRPYYYKMDISGEVLCESITDMMLLIEKLTIWHKNICGEVTTDAGLVYPIDLSSFNPSSALNLSDLRVQTFSFSIYEIQLITGKQTGDLTDSVEQIIESEGIIKEIPLTTKITPFEEIIDYNNGYSEITIIGD